MVAADSVAISVTQLTKRFGQHTAVDKLDLQVKTGEIYGFLGPNGSGKTTAIRMLCGLLTPDSGEGQCLGFDIQTQAAAIKARVGYMTQRFSLYDDLSLEENLDFVARMYQLPQRKNRVAECLQQLGLFSRRKQLAGSLSGGWKQRLALAACMLHEPKLLLLDEPTAGVDPKARREFWDEIHALAATGITVLVSTHYMDEAERCHRLAYIAYGHLLATGTCAEIVAQTGLITRSVTGANLMELAETLRKKPGVVQVAPFGALLHVSGTNAALLDASLSELPKEVKVEPVSSGLEDAFIALMQQAEDNIHG